jgi:hypothetical protein
MKLERRDGETWRQARVRRAARQEAQERKQERLYLSAKWFTEGVSHAVNFVGEYRGTITGAQIARPVPTNRPFIT